MERTWKVKPIVWILLSVVIVVIGVIVFFVLNKESVVRMPNWTGKTVEEIETWTKENHISLEKKEIYHEEVQKNMIISQNIEPDTKVKKETHLVITISLGSEVSIWRENKVDEAGHIPVMMYHGIHNLKDSDTAYTGGNIDLEGYQRTAESFRRDLEFYYQKGYRMIRLEDYIHGKIDVPLGKSPIVLTFDDGLKNNITVTGLDQNGNIVIDPNSAVGILEEFKAKYSDFQVTATFFVNGGLFGQPEYDEKILVWLVEHGYDVGNHTKTHVNFTKVDSNRSMEEVGYVYQELEKIIPGKYVNIVALPFGTPYESKHANFPFILSGTYNGISYTTESTLRVGWESDYSPFLKEFNPQFIKRIRAYDHGGTQFDIAMCFQMLDKNRYISDGNSERIVVLKNHLDSLKETTLEVKSYE